MRPNLRSRLLEIIRNNASPDWSTFPKSLQPMDSPVILTNHKHISGLSTNHQWHPQLGENFYRKRGVCQRVYNPTSRNQCSFFRWLVKEQFDTNLSQTSTYKETWYIWYTLCSSIYWSLIHHLIKDCCVMLS